MSVSFCMALAGQAVGVSALFDETRAFCRDYLTDAPPSLRVEITPADIAFEKEKSRREAICEGRAPFDYSDAYLETLAVYRKIAAGLLDYDTLLFHGSVVAVDGAAYLFTAKSGTGKSTHTRLWQKQFGARAVMVNDDKPLIRIREDGVGIISFYKNLAGAVFLPAGNAEGMLVRPEDPHAESSQRPERHIDVGTALHGRRDADAALPRQER